MTFRFSEQAKISHDDFYTDVDWIFKLTEILNPTNPMSVRCVFLKDITKHLDSQKTTKNTTLFKFQHLCMVSKIFNLNHAYMYLSIFKSKCFCTSWLLQNRARWTHRVWLVSWYANFIQDPIVVCVGTVVLLKMLNHYLCYIKRFHFYQSFSEKITIKGRQLLFSDLRLFL